MYGDVSRLDQQQVQSMLKKDKSQLIKLIDSYFVGIEKNGSENPADWTYGALLSPKTDLVFNLISGAMYDRGGTYQGAFSAYSQGVDKPNFDINQGYLQIIYSLLEKTWGSGMRADLKARITQLTQAQYATLQQERKQIADAEQQEAKLFQPLDQNTIANINAQPYAWVANIQPPRSLKQYANKYYWVSPSDQSPAIIIDYNVGDANKDNRLGMSYDQTGKAIIRLEGWLLENMRAYGGVVVQDNGQQVLDVASDHPAIPMNSMLKLETGAIVKLVDEAKVIYSNAVQAFTKASATASLTKLKQDVSDAARRLALRQQALDAAGVVKRSGLPQTSGVTYDFYLNQSINAYFVRVKTTDKDVYYDLVAGYGYNSDGSPRIRSLPLLSNTVKSKADFLIVDTDATGLFFAVMQAADGNYHAWTLEDTNESKDGNSILYTMFNNDELDEKIIIVKHTDTALYDVYSINAQTNETSFLNTYAAGSLQYSSLRYFRTGGLQGAYRSQDDPINPVLLVWDGGADLKWQKILYKTRLINLQGSGSTYTGQYTDDNGTQKTITLTRQEKSYGPSTKASWITIVDGTTTLDFMYDTVLLDPQLPVAGCPSSTEDALRSMKLNYWKQCVWSINAVIDSLGVNRLMNSLPTLNLLGVDIGQVYGLPDEKNQRTQDIRNILGQGLSRISFDQQNNRYVVMLSSSSDGGWSYFQDALDGWYVDLANGILYDTQGFPASALMASQL
jgi:hypothetical protein